MNLVKTLTTRRHMLIAAPALRLAPRVGAAQQVNKLTDDLKNGEFNWFPERSPGGPVIIVSIPDQLVHVYRNGIRIAASTCSTGKPGHRTPTGVFQILQKGLSFYTPDPSEVGRLRHHVQRAAGRHRTAPPRVRFPVDRGHASGDGQVTDGPRIGAAALWEGSCLSACFL